MMRRYLSLIFAFANAFWILWIKFPKLSREKKLIEIQNWATRVLHMLGIQVNCDTTSFEATEHPQLLVANHVSWLDVLVIQSIQPSVFVAKSEVRQWPVIGLIAQSCGVVFVDRSSLHSARKMVDEVASALHHGYCVAGFPEGTSSDGRQVSLFHANLFEAAIHHQVDVRPLAIRYKNTFTGELSIDAAFIDDIGFLESLHKVISLRRICVDVHLGKPLSPKGHTRRTLAHLSHRTVSTQLELLAA